MMAFGACADSAVPPDDFGYEGTGIAVAVAPLDLEGVNDACYSFEVKNGLDQRVVARGSAQDPGGTGVSGQNGDGGPSGLSGREANPLCSSRFGDGGGAISYVAPCDASPGSEDHTVTLWVNAVCQSGSIADNDCVPMYGYQNPCGNAGCVVNTTCVEDSDVPVQFNFTIMASAKQGFFDIAVRFDEVFCSAKLDTCYEDGGQINLLFDDSGNEAHTAVAAIACTAGTEALTTHLYHTTFKVTCGEDVYTLPLAGVDEEGNIDLQGPDGQTINAAVYFGTEALVNGGAGSTTSANKVFTNIAFVLPEGSCEVDWLVVPSDEDECPTSLDGENGSYTQVAGVAFNGTVTQDKCDNYALDESDEVATTYLESTGAAPYSGVLVEGAQAFTNPNCVNTTVLSNGASAGCVAFTPDNELHTVTVRYACDDQCTLYFNGVAVPPTITSSGSGWRRIFETSLKDVPTGCNVIGIHVQDTGASIAGYVATVSVDGAQVGTPGFFVTAQTPAITVSPANAADADGNHWTSLAFDDSWPVAQQCGSNAANTWASSWNPLYQLGARPIWYNTTCGGSYQNGYSRMVFTIQ